VNRREGAYALRTAPGVFSMYPIKDRRADEPAVRGSRTGLSWAAALFGCVVVLAMLGGFIFYRLVTLPERAAAAGEAQIARLLQAAKQAFADTVHLQPRIVVNQRVVYEQASPILELAVLQRELSVERETENNWLGSTKRFRIRGTYRVKAGYDLRQPFEVKIDDRQPQVVRARLPRTKLLSVELEKLDLMTMENGLWNKVQPEEFAIEVNGLNMDARRAAQTEGLAAEAEKMLTGQLEQKLGPDIRLEIAADPLPTPRSTPKL
jgi:hypothetical protein